jgi:multidrug efflux pump subunit AcrA (membrane-fusion protein)
MAWQVQLLKQAQVDAGLVAAAAVATPGQPAATTGTGASPGESPTPTSSGVADSGGVVHESKGYLLPRHQILISPKVGGMVKSLRVRPPGSEESAGQQLIEGMQVNKGDILAELETTDYDADVLHAKANFARAQLRLEMERKNLPREIDRANAELAEAVAMRDFYKSPGPRSDYRAKRTAAQSRRVGRRGGPGRADQGGMASRQYGHHRPGHRDGAEEKRRRGQHRQPRGV